MLNSGLRSRHGGVIVFCALAMLVLIAMTGLVVDGGNLFLIRQRLQSAVDAGALGAAQLLPATSGVTARATFVVTLNGPGGQNLAVTARPNYGGDPDRVEVTATVTYTPSLLAVLGVRVFRIGARAVGRKYVAPTTFDPFSFAGIYGENSVSFTGGGLVDSYNSALGVYNAALGGGVFNKNTDASVISDGAMNISGSGFIGGAVSTPMPVTMSGNAHVKSVTAGGDVTLNGANALVDGKVTTNGTFTGDPNNVGGTITENAGVTILNHTLPQIDTSVPAASNNNGSLPAALGATGNPPSITVNGDVTLPPGTYYLNNFTMTNKGLLRTNGETKIFVTGTWSMNQNGDFANATNNKLGIYYSGSGTMNMSPKSQNLSAGVYAPNADIDLQAGSSISGVYVAKSVKVAGQGQFHVDTGLSMPIAVTDNSNNVFALTE